VVAEGKGLHETWIGGEPRRPKYWWMAASGKGKALGKRNWRVRNEWEGNGVRRKRKREK
jgi:hypothetical protein